MDKDMNWNYEEIAKKLAMGCIDLEEASISFMLGEARKRHDGDVLAYLASVWFEDVKGDKRRALELFVEAAELGSPDANYRLGHEYRSGETLPRNYEKAYVSFRKGEECDWVPIDPEDNMSIMEDYDGEVTSEFLLLHAPDVAISEAAVGAALSPLIFIVALKKIRGGDDK